MNQNLESQLNSIGESYHRHRAELMRKSDMGLTKLYNQFHNAHLEQVRDDGIQVPEESLTAADRQTLTKKYGKETVAILQHLAKGKATISFEDFVAGILKLRALHTDMDMAVLEAYGWHEASEAGPAIALEHAFYEVDYLPENDRIRYTIAPQARKEVLKRLLLLNHQRHAEETGEENIQVKMTERTPMPKTTHSAPATRAIQQILLSNSGYAIGQKLRHPSFGVGTLKAITGTGSSETLTIDFSGTERHLLSSMTPLERAEE